MSYCTRKQFFRLGASKAAEGAEALLRNLAERVAAGLPPRPGPRADAGRKRLVRPPGAVQEEAFLQRCTRCDACIKACPHWVIRKAGEELGRRIGGTPIFLPAENPCLMCEEFPCIAACETGALMWPSEGESARIGVAVPCADTCYLAQGQPCDYCEKECPTAPVSITASSRGRPAEVDAQTCTGCGKCAQICPARAIEIEAVS